MKTRVFNLIILDESGSMSCIERQALSGLNETLQTIRSAQTKFPEREQLVSIVPFASDSIRLIRNKVSIADVQDLRADEYNPGGCTPLYDAIGFGVQSIRHSVSDDDTVLVTIITDGYENASREFNSRTIAQLIADLKEKGWMFTYIGANQDAVEVAKTMNISNALNFVQDDAGTNEMFRRERMSRERYFEATSCCPSMSADEAKELRRRIAKDDKYFDEA